MGSVFEDRQQAQLELAGLRRTLKWTNIQREQLLDRLDLLRLDEGQGVQARGQGPGGRLTLAPVTAAGGVFGSGGSRAFQLAAKFTF